MERVRLTGLIHLGIGLMVLVNVWHRPFNAVGEEKLFYQLFATLFAIAFILGGIRVLMGRTSNANRNSAVSRKRPSQHPEPIDPPEPPADQFDPPSPREVGYQCSNCGAPLGDAADVSPQGDVKCAHCNRWFNIYGRS